MPFDPILNGFEFGVGEAAGIAIFVRSGLGFPGRHDAGGGHGGDELAVFGDVDVADEREGSRFAGPVAGGAVGMDDGRDVFTEGGLGLCGERR